MSKDAEISLVLQHGLQIYQFYGWNCCKSANKITLVCPRSIRNIIYLQFNFQRSINIKDNAANL